MSKLILPSTNQEEDNVVPFARPIRGGGGPPKYGKVWLKELQINSLFLVKDKHNTTFELIPFHYVMRLSDKTAQVFNKDIGVKWVDFEDFSNRFELREELGIVLPDDDKPTEQPATTD